MSKAESGGRNNWIISEAINSSEITGTERTSSMYSTQSMRTTGSFERRPRASKIPSGRAKIIPAVPRNTVTSMPANLVEETSGKPAPPLSSHHITIGSNAR